MSDNSRQMGDASSQRTEFDPQNNAPQAQQNDTEDNGSLEPRDSRNVTGASGGAGIGSPGGSDQDSGGQRWGGGQQGQTETPDAAGNTGSQQQAEEVEFDADPAIEQSGEEVDFEPSDDLGQQSQSMGNMNQSSGSQSLSGSGDQMNQSSGASGQYGEQASGENTASDQMSQYDSSAGGQMGGAGTGHEIREHMEVIGADGVHLGTVDHIEGDRIKLTKADSGMGSHQGHHHYISRGLVAGVEGDKVRLSATAANAVQFEEEE